MFLENFKNNQINFYTLAVDIENYDTNAIYQREFIWNEPAQIRLMCSIFNDVPIGPIHVVNQNNNIKMVVLDGKQRITTIKRFLDGDIKIPYIDRNGKFEIPFDGIPSKTCKYMTYPELIHNAENNNLTNKNSYTNLLSRLNKYNRIFLCEYENLSIQDQILIFNQINFLEKLCSEEKIYCSNYKTRILYKAIATEIDVKRITQFFSRKKIREHKRFSHIRFVHNICHILYGNSEHFLMDEFSYRDLQATAIKIDSQKFHRKCPDDILCLLKRPKSIIEKFGLQQQVKLLKTTINLFERILLSKNDLKRKKDIHTNVASRYIMLLARHLKQQTLTVTYIENNIEKFYQGLLEFTNYITVDDRGHGLKQASASTKSIRLYITKLEEILTGCGVDFVQKNGLPNSYTKRIAAFEAPRYNSHGEVIRDQNSQFDHSPPKCITSTNSKIEVLTDNENRIKNI